MTRDTSTSGLIVRTAFAEVAALQLLKKLADPALCDAIAADLNAAVAEITAALKARNDPKTLPILTTLPAALAEVCGEIAAIKR